MELRYSFGSDNHSGVHPTVFDTLLEANRSFCRAYGSDPWTENAQRLFRETFGADCEAFFVFTGTAANTMVIRSLCQRHEAVVATEMAHINEDECGAPEAVAGNKLLTFPSADGKLLPHVIDELRIDRKDPHRVVPRLLSLTQSTEVGTLYQIDELRELIDRAHRRGLLVHVDGARIANAAAALGCELDAITTKIGVDVLSFGATKNGLMGAEAVVFLKKDMASHFPFVRKQSLQLASKMRFLSAQFTAYLSDHLWLQNAHQANHTARYLRQRLTELEEFGPVSFPYPTQANAVFVHLPDRCRETFETLASAYRWGKTLTRFVCSFNSTTEHVDQLIADGIKILKG